MIAAGQSASIRVEILDLEARAEALLAPGALKDAIPLPIQGYDAPATVPSPLSGCLSDANHVPGTDILVIRRADTATLLTTAAVGALLWLVYQYVFLVYSAATPGMQMAQLELCTFQGQRVPVSLRRWRALASLLSCCSLGLGFAWALIDEDMLGWHDRITQTHVRGIR